MREPRGQAEPEFRPDEFLETLLRIRRDQPRRYAREVSSGQQRRVELYEERKARAGGSHVSRAKFKEKYSQFKGRPDAEVDAAIRASGYEPMP